MVTAFLEIAEIQAISRQVMYMRDWVERLDGFLKLTNKNILDNAGSISHHDAIVKAHQAYESYKEKTKNDLSQVENDFIKQLETETKQLKNKK